MTAKKFKTVFFVLSISIFIIVAIRAAVVPFCHDEIATFYYYIQGGDFLPYTSHLDTNNHFLNSFLAWVCFHLFGDSPFSLRLPNLLNLVVLIFAVYRLIGKLTQTSSKVILVAGLLLSFHWLSFFSVCRGYGISMSLMTLALTYIPDYIEDKKLAHILKIYILFDIAICANLMLIIVALIVTALICLYQLYHHRFFKTGNIVALFIHAIVILFWVKYSFYAQHTLSQSTVPFTFAGVGESYWKVTYVTLIYTIIGKQNFWINIAIVITYSILMVICSYFLIKNVKQIQSKQAVFIFFLAVVLNGLIIGFYLLKKLCGINFPEDRTGLFFYVLFILNAAFIIDNMKPYFSNLVGGMALIIFMTHFACNVNFNKHSLDMYDVIPKRFYDRLLQEQTQNPEKITIGGNRFRELLYGFMNYRHNGALNFMDVPINPNTTYMNTDYYIALKRDRKYYTPFYQEIDTDKEYGFTLLKRKQPLTRKLVLTIQKRNIEMTKDREYCNFLEMKDTTFDNPSPLLIDINFKVQSGDMPSQCWIVLSVDSADGQSAYYRRVPLNWVKYNWLDGKNNDLILETGPLPLKIHRLVCYLWNVQGQQLKMEVNTTKVFQLEGFGAAAQYTYMGDEGL